MKNFKQIFSKPSRETRPWIVWIWNMALSRQELIAQLNGLLSQGFGGIIIRPGREMFPAYLSEEFFSFFKTVLDTAKEHGAGIRIADDFAMPWSDCFRAFLNQNEKLRARRLVLRESVIRKDGEVFEYAAGHPDSTIILATKVKNLEISIPDVKHLNISGNAPLLWKAPAGEWRIFVLKQEYILGQFGGYMPNVFNARTAQLYIQCVLNEFKTRFAKYIGATFKGFLTEMPAYRPSNDGLPWDDDLVVKFRTKYKKDLLKYLPALFCNAEQAGRIRNQVYAFLDESMYERFAYPLEMWAKNCKMTQWLLCPERTLYRANNALLDGDFHTHEKLSTVGIQNLDGTEGNFIMARAMADCNASEYRRGTLAMIGRNAVGAAATIQSLKDEVVLSLLAGASPIIIDGSYFSLDQRSSLKTPHNPIWYPFIGNHFKSLCDYASTFQDLLRNVTFSRPLAILSPTGSIRAAYLPFNGEEPSRRGLHLLQKATNVLLRREIDFEILSEEYLISCTVKPTGEFGKTDRKGKSLFHALLLPYAPLISRSALVFLEKLVSRGGKIIFVNELPRGTFEDGVNIKIAKRIEKLINPKKGGSRIVSMEELDRSLDDIPSRLKITGQEEERPDLICADGIEDDCSFYIIHNRSDRLEQVLKVEVPQEKHLSAVDCETGAIIEIPDVTREGSTCRFEMRLMPQQTTIIVGSPSAVAAASLKTGRPATSPFTGIHRNYRIVLKNQWSFEPLTFNALPLSNWTLRIGLRRESGGFSHFYESHFQIETVPSECYCAIADFGGSYTRMQGAESPVEISLNGTRLDRPLVPSFAPQGTMPSDGGAATGAISFVVPQDQVNVHYLFGAPVTLYSMKDLLVKDINRFSVRTSGIVLDPQAILYPPLVFGNFAIVRGQNGWIIDKYTPLVGIDSWTRYGYPYLSGVGVYRQMFEIPHQYSRLILRMARVSGVVDIKINGKEVGNFLWQPIEADVTSLCEPRRNELVVTIANTIDNILRLNGRPSGILGEVNIDVL